MSQCEPLTPGRKRRAAYAALLDELRARGTPDVLLRVAELHGTRMVACHACRTPWPCETVLLITAWLEWNADRPHPRWVPSLPRRVVGGPWFLTHLRGRGCGHQLTDVTMGKHGKPVPCVMCGGKGYQEESKNGTVVKKTCARCNGTGST